MYCPNCGKEQYDEEAPECYNCGAESYKFVLGELEVKYCVNCGVAVSKGAETCGNCGVSLKISTEALPESDQYSAVATKLSIAGKDLEAIPYYKKALEVDDALTPKREFLTCNAIFQCYGRSFAQRYGDDFDDWDRPELKNSWQFKDALYYAERALTALKRCDPAFVKRDVEEDPQSGFKALHIFIDIMHSSGNEIEAPQQMAKLKSSSSCFIATAVYDSPEVSEIETIREFRDKILLQSKAGEIFVGAYYRFSPPLARFISKSERRKKFVRRLILEPIIEFMKQQRL